MAKFHYTVAFKSKNDGRWKKYRTLDSEEEALEVFNDIMHKRIKPNKNGLNMSQPWRVSRRRPFFKKAVRWEEMSDGESSLRTHPRGRMGTTTKVIAGPISVNEFQERRLYV